MSTFNQNQNIIIIDLILLLFFFAFRKLMIQQKSLEKTQKAPAPEAEFPIKKELDPLKQDIVENFMKINGDKSTKVHQKISFLGKGGFAECYLTQQKDTLRKSATKIIPKKLLDSHRTKLRLANQIKLHKSLRNQYVVEFFSNFEDDENVYINLQVCQYGSINDILRARYTFTTPQVQSLVYGVCHGLKYLHSRNIIHRDLKLGNIFLNSDFKVKIGDFGLACKLQFAREFKRTVCGTPNYIAPQVLEGKGYHFQIDVWALGVMIYTLYFTIPPFETDEPHTTYQKIRKGDFQFPKYYDAPPQAIDLIKKILIADPMKRLTLDQVLESPFMKLGDSIPLGLPPVATKRPPTKKQLANWPSVKNKDQQLKGQLNSTVLNFLGITKKREKTMPKNSITNIQLVKRQSGKDKSLNQQKVVKAEAAFCKSIEPIENQLVHYFLNNGNYGVYNTKTSAAYTCQLGGASEKNGEKCEKMNEMVKKRSMNDSGSTKQQQMQLNECPHKIILSIKQKQLLQTKMQVCIRSQVDKQITVSKINMYKDVIMVRLSNRAIQVVYKEKDGFLINPDRTTSYFYSFAEFDQGKPIDGQLLIQFGSENKQNKNNASNQFSICSIFRSKKNEKHLLTMKKLSYLKGILAEAMVRNARKST